MYKAFFRIFGAEEQRNASQHVFHGEASKMICNIPRNPDYEKENKIKKKEITQVLPIAEQNFQPHFEEKFEKFHLI
jgi:hypothetical protein